MLAPVNLNEDLKQPGNNNEIQLNSNLRIILNLMIENERNAENIKLRL